VGLENLGLLDFQDLGGPREIEGNKVSEGNQAI